MFFVCVTIAMLAGEVCAAKPPSTLRSREPVPKRDGPRLPLRAPAPASPVEGGLAGTAVVPWGERFEHGFVQGTSCGQQGWQSCSGFSGAAFEIVRHSPLHSRLQEYSARLHSSFDVVQILSPAYPGSVERVDVDVMISNLGTEFFLLPMNTALPDWTAVTAVRFAADGSIAVAIDTDCQFFTNFAPTGATWTPGVIARIGVKVVPIAQGGATVFVYKDGVEVFQAFDFSQICTPAPAGIGSLAIRSQGNLVAGTMTIDNIGNPRDPLCPSDVAGGFAPGFGDGTTNVTDLLAIISTWGSCASPCPPHCFSDTNLDCHVNVTDLLAVISGWGVCPDPIGACCLNGCVQLSADACAVAGGEYCGDGVPCSGGVCPANAECVDAAVATLGENFSNLIGASDGPEPDVACPITFAPIEDDVWHAYTNSTSTPQLIQIDTNNTPLPVVDTVITVYASCIDALNGVTLACDEDSGIGNLSYVEIMVAPGQTIIIRTGLHWPTAPGPMSLMLTLVPPPVNDLCSNPISVHDGFNLVDTVGSTQDSAMPDPCGLIACDVWFSWTPTTSFTTFSTCGATFDTVIAVYNSCGLAASGVALGCNDNACGTASSVSLPLPIGVPHLIRVGHPTIGPGGLFYLNVIP